MLIFFTCGLKTGYNQRKAAPIGRGLHTYRYPVPQWSGINKEMRGSSVVQLETDSFTLAEKYCTADLMWSSDEGELHEFAADFSVRTTIYIQCIGCCFKAKWENRNKANIRGVNKSSTAVTRPSCTVQNESTLLENTGT
jgi:hypothetical protein